jgi:CBS domain-containing protein
VSGLVRARDLAITYPSLTPDPPAEAAGLAEVDGDDTLLTVAAALARTGASLVAVRDQDGRLLGGITTSRLIRRLLGAP